jgi:hypothetical protein
MKPICVPCQRFYRPSRNGIAFIEGMPNGNDAKPGLAEPERWRPYKLWMGDEWRCPDCEAVIIVGVGQQPINEHYKDGFEDDVKSWGGDQLQINDC